MDPITLITTALVAGAAAAANDVGGTALKDAYGALKQFIVDHYQKAKPAVEMIEDNPEQQAYVPAAAAALNSAGAADDAQLLDLAKQLQALLEKQEKAAPGSTIINVSGSGAAATGGGVAAGAGGIAIGGNVTGNVGKPSKPEDEVSDDISERLAQLKKALDAGIIDEATYRFAVGDAKATETLTVSGSGASAQTGGVAAGERGTAIGVVHGNVYVGQPTDDPATALHIYCEMFVKTHRHLPMRGVDVGASDPQRGENRLDLEQVYVSLNTTATEVRDMERDKEVGESDAHSDSFPLVIAPTVAKWSITAVEAVASESRCVLLGHAGSGKSTFINHVGLCLAQHGLAPDAGWLERLDGWPQDAGSTVPILVVLRDFSRWIANPTEKATANSLWQYIVSRLEAQRLDFAAGALADALQQGTALVMLDGLDEIPSADRRQYVLSAIEKFAERYGASRMIVTCRVLSYQKPDWQLPSFTSYELAPFSDEQIDRFIGAWYRELERIGTVTPGDAADLTVRLRDAVRRPDLYELASNPLLLTVMALVHTHRNQLPDARAELYEDSVDMLLQRWEEIKTGTQDEVRLRQLLADAGRSLVDLKKVLWRLAYEAHGAGGTSDGESGDAPPLADIGRFTLLRALADLKKPQGLDWANEVVELMRLRSGLLIEREPDVFTFPHRTFQEYLAGAHLALQPQYSTTVAALADDLSLWRQVILLSVGRLVYLNAETERPLALVGELCPNAQPAGDDGWRKTWLAGEVLGEIGLNRVQDSALGRDLLERVQGRLVDLLGASALVARERAEVGDVLARLGDPRFRADAWFLPDEPLLGFVEIPAGSFLMGSDPKKDRNADSDEQPQHTVELPAYYIARYPVTVAQFRAYLDATGGEPDDADSLRDPANRPVQWVTWHEAMAYCKWLTETLRDWDGTPEPLATWLRIGDQDGHRWHITLPSEAEWEKAARGGDGRINPWNGELTGEHANSRYSEIGSTSTVGCFPLGRSPYELEDMCGNVWEWTRSLWGDDFPYPYNPEDGRENLGASDDVRRVLRGGSFGGDEDVVRCAARNLNLPYFLYDGYGFRVVAAPIPLGAGDSVR